MRRGRSASGRSERKGKVPPAGEDPERAGAIRVEQERLAHGAAVHQIELELQNRTLRESQGQLERSWARYVELYEHGPTGHITVDAFGTIQQLNLKCASLLGRDRRLLEGVPLRVMLDPDSWSAFELHLRASLSSVEARTVQLVVLLPNGLKRPVELVTVPRSTPSGGAERILYHSAMLDISERRRADERRDELFRRERDARLLAESANQVKEDFLAMVAHELRSPLAPMLLWIRALRLGSTDTSLRDRGLAALEAGMKAHLSMVDELLDVARGRHGELRVERTPIDLRPIVHEAAESLAPAAAAKLVTVDTSMPGEPACVSGDARRLRQVATNLLSNALKFTPEGGRVAVELRLVDAEVVLIVSDNGEGLDAELLENVFEPFRQRDELTTRRQGLGLGLTIVRQLVAEHDGVVQAHSAGRGKGASFMVTLPRIEADLVPGATVLVAAPIELGRESAALAGLRILVVEDHPDTREALAGILQACGADVLDAGSSADAWPLAFSPRRPDVVVSDIGLPEEDGYAFIQRLRARESESGLRRVPAIALTGHATPRDRARALLCGFDRHVGKPIGFELLVETVSSLLRSRAS